MEDPGGRAIVPCPEGCPEQGGLVRVRMRDAKDHELERHFEQAAAAFSEIDAIWPGFKDVKARISDLESAIEVASTAFATGQAAEKKGELKAAIEAYGEAVLVYPGYKGLDQRIEQLKAKL